MIARGDTQSDVAVGDTHRFGGNRNIRHERDREARANRDSVDGRDDRLLAVEHVVDDIARFFQHAPDDLRVALHVLDHVEVAARRKRAARSGDDHDVGFVVIGDIEPDPAQLPMKPAVCSIEDIGAIDGDEQDARLESLEQKMLVFAVIHEGPRDGASLVADTVRSRRHRSQREIEMQRRAIGRRGSTAQVNLNGIGDPGRDAASEEIAILGPDG